MNEIEKLYENAGIEPEQQDCCKLADIYWDNEELADEYGIFDNYMKAKCPYNQECTDACEHAYDKENYPPFTAEKQLELIKWLINKGQLRIIRFLHSYSFEFRDYDLHTSLYYVNKMLPSIEEGISFIINNIWQDLTEEEKEQIKGILNG